MMMISHLVFIVCWTRRLLFRTNLSKYFRKE